ncbi:hypothetical protein QFC24_006680 [Naganishia onofrii]|uniref:Uncharacterized protein n=1 Tax=Naganishia onofrii TaxID=1851511 RepID=A0ACC2X155_9TREE|nr:hypothetical protein QFC24_006680 [Naganishia onofrii]
MPTLSHEQLAVSAAKLAESFMAAQAEGEVSYTDDLIGKVSGNRSNFSEDDYQGIVTCLEKRKARQQQQSLHRFIQESLGSLAQDTSAESSSEDEELDELSTGTTGLDELFKHLGLTHDQLESVCLYDQVVRLTEVALVLIPERPAMNIQRSISKMYMQHARLLSADQMQTLEGLVGKLAPRERSSLLLLVQMKLVKEYVFNLEQGASSDTPRSGVEFGMQMSLLRRLVRAICNEAMEEALVNNLAGDFQPAKDRSFLIKALTRRFETHFQTKEMQFLIYQPSA